MTAISLLLELRRRGATVAADRNELDGQLYESFSRSRLLPEQPRQIRRRAELRSELSGRTTGGIYFTTLFAYAAPETQVVRRMARQHRDILRALIAEDWRAARRALARHIRSQGPIVRKLLRKMR